MLTGTRETRKGVSSHFALGKMDETPMTQAVLFFEYFAIFVVKLRALFNEFFRTVLAPVLLLFVVINNSVFATCCKSVGYKNGFLEITMKEQGITTLLFAPAACGFSAGIFEILACFVVEKSCLPSVFARLPIHGLFTGNPVNYAIVSLRIPVMNRKHFCNQLEINMMKNGIFGREQEISGEASGRNRERFQGRFFEIVQSSGSGADRGGEDVHYETRVRTPQQCFIRFRIFRAFRS